jgi:TolB protein
VCLAVAVLAGATASSSEAAFPGQNGRIVFMTAIDGNEELFDVQPDGSGLRNLTNSTAVDFSPVYSPDGRHIAFGSYAQDPPGGGVPKNTGELFVMDADGSNARRITFNTLPDWNPAWSPDGKRLVFARPQRQALPDEFIPPTDLWIVDLRNGQERQLTNSADTDDTRPQWSPDGQLIVFESDTNDPGNIDVYTIRPNGRDLRRITTTPGFDGMPNYSPDGERITFTSERAGNGDVFVMRADGSRQTRLTDDAIWDGLSAFSPDGRFIAYTSERDGEPYPDGSGFFFADIFRMRTDGRQITNLTRSPVLDDFDPDWQPINAGPSPPG